MIALHVAEWTRCQREQHRLCGLLEQTAERLPLREVGAPGGIVELLDRVHRYEEDQLFPVLQAMSRQVSPLLADFKDHHRYDQGEADALVSLLDSSDMVDVHSLAPRLKALAESIRRHVQFEQAICRALFARGDSGQRAVQ